MKPTAVVVLLCGIVMAQLPNRNESSKADQIFLHGNIYTGVKTPSSLVQGQRAQAIAVRGDRIIAVGTDADISKLKGPDTRITDLQEHFVLPGLNDAHVHLAMAGFQKLEVNVQGVRSLDEFRARIREYASKAAPGEWLVGRGWDETLWPVKTTPT